MAVNKVVYGNKTVIDITDTTATPETVFMGYQGYDASGNKFQGKVGVKVENGILICNGPLFSYNNHRLVIGNYVDENNILNLI